MAAMQPRDLPYRAARDDLERIVRQRSLQSFRLIPRRAHPHVVV